MLPFALAVFFGYILNPVILFFEHRKLPSAIAILISIIITFIILLMVGLLINQSIQSFAEEFPFYEDRFSKLMANVFTNLAKIFKIPPELYNEQLGGSERFQILADLNQLSVTDIITTTLSSITRFFVQHGFGNPVPVFYFVGTQPVYQKIGFMFDGKRSAKIVALFSNVNETNSKIYFDENLYRLATAALAAAVLFYFEVNLPVIWVILTLLLNFIPIGSVIATVLPLTIDFIQFESYLTILMVAPLLTTIQFIMGSVLDPQIVGGSVNLSPLVVPFSLIFWGGLWGIIDVSGCPALCNYQNYFRKHRRAAISQYFNEQRQITSVSTAFYPFSICPEMKFF
ncbi:MAG: AI-2E family transporter [Calditrichia bacterium]